MPRVTVADVVDLLGRVAPFSKAAGWDPVGLQIGDRAAPVERIAVCHEVTAEVLDRLDDRTIDLLVTYHPLLFRPTTSLTAGPGPAGRALRLAASRTALAVVHTAFDVAAGGCADALAAALGLEEMRGFGPLWGSDSVKIVTFVPAEAADAVTASMTAAGAGRIGSYSACSFRLEGTGTFLPEEGSAPVVGSVGSLEHAPEVRIEMVAPAGAADRVVAALVASHPYEEPAFDVYERRGDAGFVGRTGRLVGPPSLGELARMAAERLGGVVRTAGDPARDVRTVAVLPGSGGSMIGSVPPGTDVLVTGDVSHHQARRALEGGLAVIDPGHASTERPGVAALYAAVAAAGDEAGAAVDDLTGIDASPWGRIA